MDEQAIRITLNAMLDAFKQTTESSELTIKALKRILPDFEGEFNRQQEDREQQGNGRISSAEPQTVGDGIEKLKEKLVRLLARP